VKIVYRAVALLLVSYAATLLAQPPAPPKDTSPPAATEPLIVDVHSSPYRPTIYYRTNLRDQRFDMRDATVLDLIALAYTREDQAILGGPGWIDFNRFDLVAKISSLKVSSGRNPTNPSSAQNPYDQIRPLIQRVLAERFHLTYHMEDRPLPGYTVTVAKEGAKLTEAKDPAAEHSCQFQQDKATPGQMIISCTSETLGQFLTVFGILPHPPIDQTGLKKSYDFTLRLALGDQQSRNDLVRIYTEAVKQQLGLVVAQGNVPQPAIVVDKVDRTPTPNLTNIAELIPPMPDLEFEVASIKPSADNEPRNMVRPTGSQITFFSFSLQDLLVRAWDLPTGAMLGDALPNLPKQRFTILVKLPPGIDARATYQDQDQINDMLKKLVVDRFQIKYHWGEQTLPAYVLLPGTPKMKKADPNSRTFCKYGAPPGEKDMTAGESPYDREFYCQNVTMAQFADLAQSIASVEIKSRVPDKTGLAGAYDFTVYFTTGHKIRADQTAAADAAKQAGDAAPLPVGGVSIEDAFRKELGIRLEFQPVTLPILILDHYEQTPTDN
jgi:uncharacterized protein (TIGR03435 family)